MIKLENEDFNEVVKEGIWIVDFYADWCGPCKMLTPILESLDFENILKVNVDEFNDISNSYGVMSIPTLIFLKNGEEKEKLIGFRSKEEIEKVLDSLK